MKSYFNAFLAILLVLSVCTQCRKTKEEVQEVLADSITISIGKELELTVGDQFKLELTVLPETTSDKSIVWSSNKEEVATVSVDGVVSALQPGTAVIKATNEASGKTAVCEVTVSAKFIPATGITLDKESLYLIEGEEAQLTATLAPENATDKNIVWSSDNEDVASVSAEGVVKALKSGTATILVKTVDGKLTANCNVLVDVAMKAITLDASNISCRSAVLTARLIIPQIAGSDFTFGILYSTSSEPTSANSVDLKAVNLDSENSFSVETQVLEPATKYYYRSYITIEGKTAYGEIKSLTTLAVSSLIQTGEATEIHQTDATVSAKLTLGDCRYNSIEYGFELKQKGGNYQKYSSDNHSGTQFSKIFEGLSHTSEYTYRAYVILDERTYYGEERNFTTLAPVITFTAEVSEIKHYSAGISGKLTVKPGDSFRKQMALYCRTSYPSDEDLEYNCSGSYSIEDDGSYSINIPNLDSNTKYYCALQALVNNEYVYTQVFSFTTLDVPEGAVSLGLSVFWATCNVSARSPQEYGSYYAWGETSYKDDYSWLTYKWCKGSPNTLTKYCTQSEYGNNGFKDNVTVLKASDDVATVKLGGKWRTPTIEEWDELIDPNNCEWAWINGYKNTTVRGYVVTSKKPGYTDKSIFLPAAFYQEDTTIYNESWLGIYWSSSLDKENSYRAHYVYFTWNLEDWAKVNKNCYKRYLGYTIRPVSD